MKKAIAKKLQVKKIVVKNLNTKTGVKGGGFSHNSCYGRRCEWE